MPSPLPDAFQQQELQPSELELKQYLLQALRSLAEGVDGQQQSLLPGARLSRALHACCQRAVVIAPCRALHLPAACSPSPVLAMGYLLHKEEVLGTPPTSRSLPGQQFPLMPRPLRMIPSVWCRKHLQVGSCCWVRGWQGEAQVHRLALQLCMWYPHSATQCWEPLKLACACDACLYSLSALKPPIA